MVAAPSALAAATGLRLCGMVEEPPRPSPEGSKASPTSVCIISERRARSCRRCRREWRTRSRFRDAVAMGVPGRLRQRQLQFLRQSSPRPAIPCRRGRRACRRRRRIAVPASRRAAAAAACASGASAAAYSASFNPNGIGSACCSQVRATTGCCDAGAPVWQSPRSRGRYRRAAHRCRRAVRAWSPVSITSWLVAPQCT